MLYVFLHLADKSNEENKKMRVLKLLAIKAACFLKWNLSDLEKRYVSVVTLHCCIFCCMLRAWSTVTVKQPCKFLFYM